MGFQLIWERYQTDIKTDRYYLEKTLINRIMNILLTSAGRRTYLVEYFKKLWLVMEKSMLLIV